MSGPTRRDRLALLLIGFVVLFAPALFLVITLEALVLLGDIEFSDLTVVELLELYLLDMALLVAFAYAVYRVTLYVVENRLPPTLDRIGDDVETGSGDDVETESGDDVETKSGDDVETESGDDGEAGDSDDRTG